MNIIMKPFIYNYVLPNITILSKMKIATAISIQQDYEKVNKSFQIHCSNFYYLV